MDNSAALPGRWSDSLLLWPVRIELQYLIRLYSYFLPGKAFAVIPQGNGMGTCGKFHLRRRMLASGSAVHANICALRRGIDVYETKCASLGRLPARKRARNIGGLTVCGLHLYRIRREVRLAQDYIVLSRRER